MQITRALQFAATMILVIAVTITLAFAQNEAIPQTNTAAIEKAVLARLAEIQKAAESLDVEKVFSFVAENNQGALIQNGKLFLTRQAALDSNHRGFQGLNKLSYRFDRQQISVLSPTTALAVGEGTSSATTSDGRTFETRFAQTVVLVLTNGQWQVWHAHRSFPPAN